MRLSHLDLIRFGKFSGRRLELPAAERDFHVIVGPNEAGKSTVRAAVSDLLFGIPAKTRHAFVHAMPELRLGAGLATASAALEVHRVKGNKQTLRSPADQPLADNALAPFLGSTDRQFFDQMFSLDHERMVKGGRSILSASDNLGQILFQSAAGIASLGSVRDDLNAQADKLWAKRASKDRQYTIAADALERATAALKLATVRTKDWAAAQSALDAVQQRHDGVRQQLAAVRQQRARLERVRRVLPALQALATHRAQLAALTATGEVLALPEGAAQALLDAERALGTEQVAIDHQQALRDQAQAALAEVVVDRALLAAAADITELDAQRLQYRTYAGDMARRQAERDALWAVAQRLAALLGWPADDAQALQQRLPAEGLRQALAKLARSHAALQQAVDVAQRALRRRQAEVSQAQAEHASLPPPQAPLALQAALARAQKLGDAPAVLQAAQQRVDQQTTALEQALAGLGRWRQPLATLQAMTPPAPERLRALGQEALADAAQARALAARLSQLQQQHQQAELAVQQYQASHDAVTRADVLDARQQRDQTWQALQAGADALAQHGASFTQQLAQADTLADRRHDTAEQASELQSRQAQADRLALELAQARHEATLAQAQADQRQRHWADLASACGLPDQPVLLPFDAAVPWLDARAAALAAADSLAQTEAERQRVQAAVASACAALAQALHLEPGAADSDTDALERLAGLAEERLRHAASLDGRRQALDKQLADAAHNLATLQDEAQAAQQALASWATAWAQRLAEAGFAPAAEPLVVEGQLASLDELAQALADRRRIQVERIDKMQADLDQHAAAAQALATRLQPALQGQPAEAIASALAAALASAHQAEAQAQRLRAEHAQAEQAWRAATLRHEQARAAVAPLMQRAGVDSLPALAAAIARSDQQRALQAAITAAERSARDGGDGLALAALQAEADGVDAAGLVAELGGLVSQEDELVSALAAASAQRQAAGSVLSAIAGTADAALAEAQRQQALAAMAEAVERYVKVYTAARLLGWSIERYREAKQGPMLAAASAIFARLTLGSFDRLVVDFEHEPPRLQGRRPGGTVVDIEGMSEGTQDQLFLALRLAALDLHLDHAQVLPFIADDLFINYDDRRSEGGLQALGELSRKTQVLFLTHHDHLLPVIHAVFGPQVNVVRL